MRRVRRDGAGTVAVAGREVATAARAGAGQPGGGDLRGRRAQVLAPESLRAASLKRAAESLRASSLKRSGDGETALNQTTGSKRPCRTNGNFLQDLVEYSGKSVADEIKEQSAAKSAVSCSSTASTGLREASADYGRSGERQVPQSSVAPDGAVPKRRMVVRQKILDALSRNRKGNLPVDVSNLAAEVEGALFSAFEDNEKEYTSKARSVLFNLNDARNADFRAKLLVGFISPADVPHLSAEDMASHEKEVDRAKMRQESMEEIQTDWDIKHGAASSEGMFTCGRCKSTKTTYHQMQTRSADEPMTTFVACLTCGKRWKC